MKRWFLTTDWCSKGNRGIFCNGEGHSFSQEHEHTKNEIWKILGAFDLVLSPKSIELSEDELKQYHLFQPYAEYSGEYGVALKDEVEAEVAKS